MPAGCGPRCGVLEVEEGLGEGLALGRELGSVLVELGSLTPPQIASSALRPGLYPAGSPAASLVLAWIVEENLHSLLELA